MLVEKERTAVWMVLSFHMHIFRALSIHMQKI